MKEMNENEKINHDKLMNEIIWGNGIYSKQRLEGEEKEEYFLQETQETFDVRKEYLCQQTERPIDTIEWQ